MLFASNRGHDSISVFNIKDDNSLELLHCLPSGNSSPRDFAIDPEEKFMLIANETGNQVNVQKINHETKSIEPTSYLISLYRPSCIQFWTLGNEGK